MQIKRIFYWVGLTITQPFNTGIQRVTRCLALALERQGIQLIPVKWDDISETIVSITENEAEILAGWGGPRLKLPTELPSTFLDEWLLIPEITPNINVPKIGKSHGMFVAAIFYDMIPLKTPDFYHPAALEWLTQYWRTFSIVNIALPISQLSADDLDAWLAGQFMAKPTIVTCSLSGELPNVARISSVDNHRLRSDEPLRLLTVGTWEPRKNYPRILRALIAAREMTGQDIRLSIVGQRPAGAFQDFINETLALSKTAGRGVVTLFDHLSDEALVRESKSVHATVYGSWVEGFGLPVLESLWRGLPCICHNGSALAEIAPGGGTMMVDMLDEGAIAHGIARLATEDGLLSSLSSEAVSRPIKTWEEYGGDVLSALQATNDFLSQPRVRTMLAYNPLGY